MNAVLSALNACCWKGVTLPRWRSSSSGISCQARASSSTRTPDGAREIVERRASKRPFTKTASGHSAEKRYGMSCSGRTSPDGLCSGSNCDSAIRATLVKCQSSSRGVGKPSCANRSIARRLTGSSHDGPSPAPFREKDAKSAT